MQDMPSTSSRNRETLADRPAGRLTVGTSLTKPKEVVAEGTIFMAHTTLVSRTESEHA